MSDERSKKRDSIVIGWRFDKEKLEKVKAELQSTLEQLHDELAAVGDEIDVDLRVETEKVEEECEKAERVVRKVVEKVAQKLKGGRLSFRLRWSFDGDKEQKD